MPETRLDDLLPDAAAANDDSSIPFHAMGNGHNRPNAEFSTETFRSSLDRLLHEVDRGGSFRKHKGNRSPTVRVEKHHLSPRPTLRDSDRQRLPVHIKIFLRILRDNQQNHNRRFEEMPRPEKRVLG